MSLESLKLILIAVALFALLLSSCTQRREPRAAYPPDNPLPPSPTGYEVYSWQAGREWYHALITGTRRAKTVEEIMEGENAIETTWVSLILRGIYDLEATIDRLPPQSTVAWIGPRTLRRKGASADVIRLPPRRQQRQVQALCQEASIRLLIEQ
jgi:hypothetical protein